MIQVIALQDVPKNVREMLVFLCFPIGSGTENCCTRWTACPKRCRQRKRGGGFVQQCSNPASKI